MRKTSDLWPIGLLFLAFGSGTTCMMAGCANEPVGPTGQVGAPQDGAPQDGAPQDGAPQDGAQQELKFQPQVVIPRAFPAIVQPKAVSAEAASEIIHAEELVLGVEVGGVARAYPINMLTGPQREIINDQLGGEAIAATW